MSEEFYADVAKLINKGALSKDELSAAKNRLAKKHNLKKVPTDIQIFLHTDEQILTKPARTMSGVAPLALMTAPFACPHGKCTYCPGGPNSIFGDVPQSYTGSEPSTMRAIRNSYDPYLIVFNRLEQYAATGHCPDKMEVIIQGGTFPAIPETYQEEFIKYAFKAMNDFGKIFYTKNGLDSEAFKKFFELPCDINDAERTKRIHERCRAIKGKAVLDQEKLRNETAKVRCVALCVETKPDWCFEPHINNMLRFGTTRVELGVQCLKNEVLKKTNRGHDLKDTVKATRLLKDSFLKVCYHMMPGLPGQSKQEDISMFKELFDNPEFMPDSLKIYPTMVLPGTALHAFWKAGQYEPLSVEDAADILVEAKKFVPKWCRIMRVQRDIPSTVISAGPKMNNIRQLVMQKLEKKGIKCKCIRCREPRNKTVDFEQAKITRTDYEASGGTEVFLAFEDSKNDVLLGFCRLRIPARPFRPEITERSAGIRELHVYGKAIAIGSEGIVQHKGVGKKLVQEAERIAKKEFGCNKLLVIAGVGVRQYYYKLGYKPDGAYVSKRL